MTCPPRGHPRNRRNLPAPRIRQRCQALPSRTSGSAGHSSLARSSSGCQRAVRAWRPLCGIGLTWDAVNLDGTELDIGWQLQRVRGQLLHRETKTEASDATLPLPGICVTALHMRQKAQAQAKAAAAADWVDTDLVFTTRVGTRLSRATSTGVSRPAAPGQASGGLPFTTPGTPVPRSWPHSTRTLAWPCASCGMRRSTSR
jgi:hypothetical protein